MSTNDSERYNGWTNRETWAVALHINNDQAWQGAVHELIRERLAGEGAAWSVGEVSEAQLAGEAIKDNVEDMLDPSGYADGDAWAVAMAPVLRDIGSLWRVDWNELGAAFLEDMADHAPDDDDLDTTSSASRQHYIDTGEYLRRGETEED